MKTTSLLVYLYQKQKQEIIVGTLTDLQPWQAQGYQLVCFMGEDELYQAIAPYWARGWTIRFVSVLPNVQEKLRLLSKTTEPTTVHFLLPNFRTRS